MGYGIMQKQPTDFIYAGIWPRAAAYIIDKFVIALLCMFVKLPVWASLLVSGTRLSNVIFNFTALDVVCYIIGALYFTLLTWKSGRTLGKYLMKLTVVTEDGTQLCFFRVLYRETVGRFLTGILLIGYIAAGCDFEKRGFHDRLCDTRVIYSLGRYAAYTRLPKDPQTSGNNNSSAEFSNLSAAGATGESAAAGEFGAAREFGAVRESKESGVIGDADLPSLGFVQESSPILQPERRGEDIKDEDIKNDGRQTNGSE